MAGISFRHVVKTYDNGVTVVPDLNLEIKDKEFVVLVGPSGCGKSTTLRIIAGLESVSDGELYIGDKLMNKVPPKSRNIAMVFQSYALYPHMSVYKNMAFALELAKTPKDEIDRKVREAASLLGLEPYLERKPKALSGGQRQRVALGRAMVRNPEVFLLDEPLSNLDARLRLQTREEIRRIQKETGITTIFVTHDQEEAMSISDLIIVMKDGIIQQTGVPQEVYNAPANLFVARFLGTPAINVFKGFIRDHKVYIGEDAIMKTKAPDQEVYVGIRPEGFIPSKKGVLSCGFDRIETTGRDTSVVCHNENCISDEDIRAIVDDDLYTHKDRVIRFDLKPHKTYVFSMDEKVIDE